MVLLYDGDLFVSVCFGEECDADVFYWMCFTKSRDIDMGFGFVEQRDEMRKLKKKLKLKKNRVQASTPQ